MKPRFRKGDRVEVAVRRSLIRPYTGARGTVIVPAPDHQVPGILWDDADPPGMVEHLLFAEVLRKLNPLDAIAEIL